MAFRISRAASGAAMAAALSMAATPAMAQGWGGGGWGGRHRDHDDTGWIVGGIIGLITVGAIAAAASNKNKRDRDYREGSYPDDTYRSRDDNYRGGDYQQRDYRGSNDRSGSSYAGGNIDGAVDACVGEIERGSTRVDTVDGVDRESGGWRIQGRVNGGREFTCVVDGNGRVTGASVDGRGL